MKKIRKLFEGLVREDDGASMVEYAIGVGFIAAAVIIGVAIFGGKLQNAFTNLGNTVEAGANGSAG